MRANAERKAEHIRVCLEHDVQAQGVTAGFEHYRLTHEALPEMGLADVDTSTWLAGKRLRSPLVVSAMTGGTDDALAINRNLATAAQQLGLAMVLGSQRSALEDATLRRTYQVRDVAPDILLFANLGAVQLGAGYGIDECRLAIDMIEADGIVLHLNPLQECLQPGGDNDFRRLSDRIRAIVEELRCPVMVKEVGWGISERVASLLHQAAVPIIDVAGAGGTSWSEVEGHRAESDSVRRVASAFVDWGIPTCEAILNVRRAAPGTVIVASGGVRTGVDVAKAIALGATAAGLALPLLAPAVDSAEAVIERLGEIDMQLRIAMLCTASRRLENLPQALAPAGGQRERP